jgi:hypothetical protein
MKTLNHSFIAICLIVLGAARAYPAENQAAGAGVQVHIYASPKAIIWASAPPVVPKGAETVVLDGDPFASSGLYTLRLKMPAGLLGSPPLASNGRERDRAQRDAGRRDGSKFDKSSGSALKAGGFVCMPKDVHHYAWAQGPTTIQVHGLAPFTFTYVNPSDDPRYKH